MTTPHLRFLRAWTLAAAGAVAAWGAVSAQTIQPPASIATAKKIVFCADISAPPLTFFEANGKPAGVEIELGDAIARRLGVSAEWRNVGFSGIIPALLAQQCDVIMSQLYNKPARREVIDFVDYMKATQALVVAAGNPSHIQSLDDLSGRKVAVENGTTIQSMVEEQNKKFAAAGRPPATIIVFPKDTDAFQALRIGQVQVYGATLESAGYYLLKAPGLFEIAGAPFAEAIVGAGFRKQDKDLQKAYTEALAALQKDGTYASILTRWNLAGDALQ
jgi:polar amino acid transport system substrate-binding protein